MANIPETLYAKIRVKRSIVPLEIPTGLELGEIAVNIPDRKIYIGDQTGSSVVLSTDGEGSGIIYTGSSTITISGSNQISFNPSGLANRSISVNKIDSPGGTSSSGFLKWTGSVWILETPEVSQEGEIYSAGTGISIGTDNTINFDPDDGSIPFAKLKTNDVSGTTGYLKWNGSSWSFDQSLVADSNLTAGLGIDISTNDVISVDVNEFDSNSIPLTKLRHTGVSGATGFLKWDGFSWLFDTPSGSGNGDGGLCISDIFDVLGGYGFGLVAKEYYISGGDATGIFSEYDGNENCGGGTLTLSLTAGSGLFISTDNEISIEPSTIPDSSIELSKLNIITSEEAIGYLYFDGTSWSIDESLVADSNLTAGLGIDISTDDVISVDVNEFNNNSIELNKLKTTNVSGTTGYLKWNGSSWSFDQSLVADSNLTAGLGIDISTNDVISVDVNEFNNYSIPLTKLKTNDVSGGTGYLKWNGFSWSFDDIITSTDGVVGGIEYTEGYGIDIIGNQISFDHTELTNYSIPINKITFNSSSAGYAYWNGNNWILQETDNTDASYVAGSGISIAEINNADENSLTFSVLIGSGLAFSGNSIIVDTSLIPIINNVGEEGFLFWDGNNWSFENLLSSDFIGSVINLDDLLNVETSNDQNGDMLVFDGQHWINVSFGTYNDGIFVFESGGANLY